ncbi:PDZ domain-containing protein [Marisediminicola sp. LYQ134]|uniref:YlbL family protein n=1 Tax=unclassified Marisediminicola TaxID=2618316 RepID=UPI0039839B05
MTLFADDTTRSDAGTGERAPRSRRVGWGLVAAAAVGTLVLSLLPSPYVIEQPGPVIDTLGDVTVAEESVPLISIPGEETFPTEGRLSLLTVNVVGNREQQPTWFEVVTSWADPSRAVVPVDAIYPEGQTVEQSNEQSAVDMENSQKDAVAASLTELGYDFDSTLTVAASAPDSPADGVFVEGDEIVSVNGRAPVDVTELRSIIADNGTGSPVDIEVLRDGRETPLDVTPVMLEGSDQPVVGISVATEYDFPFDVEIQLERIGGPSAGMMFALGIIDKLTPGSLTGGTNVAGTGTITADGLVGGIGGIRQKMYGAADDGATLFLAPTANCDEVVGHVPDGLTVVAVETLDDSLEALETVANGEDATDLPTCAAS